MPQQWRKQERVALAGRCGEERNHEVGVGVRGHEAGYDFGCGGIARVLPRIRNHGIGEAVLVVDGDDGKALLVSDVTGERLEVGDDQVGFPFVDEVI